MTIATERAPRSNSAQDEDTYYDSPEFRARLARADADIAVGRVYRLGPEDLEEYINLSPEERSRLHESRATLDVWLAAHAATYTPGRTQ